MCARRSRGHCAGRMCQRRRNARLDPDTQVQTFPNRRLQTEVSSLMSRRPQVPCSISSVGAATSRPPGAHCAPLRLRFSLGHVHPQGKVRDMGSATTLSRCGGCATRGFPAVRNTTTRAFGPPWFLFLTPVHPRCSARLRASYCHAAARARPGRFRCDSGWSPGRLAALRSPSLRSKLPCARPPRFSLTGAFPAPPSAPRIPACPAAHTYCSYRPPRRAG